MLLRQWAVLNHVISGTNHCRAKSCSRKSFKKTENNDRIFFFKSLWMILFAWFGPNYTAFMWFVCVFDWTIMCLRATTVTVSPCHAPLYPPPRIPSLYPRAMLVLDPTLMRLVSPHSLLFWIYRLPEYLCFSCYCVFDRKLFWPLHIVDVDCLFAFWFHNVQFPSTLPKIQTQNVFWIGLLIFNQIYLWLFG